IDPNRQALSFGWVRPSPAGADPLAAQSVEAREAPIARTSQRRAELLRGLATTDEESQSASVGDSGHQPARSGQWSGRRGLGTNVLVAWNGSTEQARTTAFAMPILKRASRVIVLTVEGGAAVPGPTGEQLCRYLQLNEVPAKPLTVGLDGRLTGEAVLLHAKALGCDLLIKGA